MHISRVELENIKSHRSATFQFTRGTTAITGENGAGKTTIIEAIAWALFDVLEYKKEEFVRRGAKKGSVSVTFQSVGDEREYFVFRDSGTTYYIDDVRLHRRVANKREEVVRKLWELLGVEPGTDLKSLFRQAIGVPQGTFTAIFLESATDRKIAFDRLLKVEEYRQAADKLRETSRYVDMSIATARESIARAEGELGRSEAVENELKAIAQQASTLARDLDGLQSEITIKRDLVARLDNAERIENEITTIRAETKYTLEKLEAVSAAKTEIAALRPKIVEQERLESEATVLREKLAEAKALETQAADLAARIARLRSAYKQHSEKIKEAEAKAAGAGDLKALEERSTALMRELAEHRAHLDRDERFQKEIKGGFCPVLSEKCLNMKPGQTLESFLDTQFTELRSHIARLEQEQATLNVDLTRTREAALLTAALDELRRREQELISEGTEAATQEKEIRAKTATRPEVETRLASLETNLNQLNDPRGRVRLLEAETTRESELQSILRTTQTKLAELEREQISAANGLKAYKGAGTATVERAAFHALETRAAVTATSLDTARTRERQLEADLTRFAELRTGLAGEFREKERLETVATTTDFIRNTLKEAAPRVARNYVYHVSIEANQMFREIMGTGQRTLRWAEDYSITLEEDGFERPFASLSGGEQMVAALAVRLAILKQLSDIRIAFFDEPTTNMDAERRENLALQISRITHFDQLFVISHDETFDNFVDSVVHVHREGPPMRRAAG